MVKNNMIEKLIKNINREIRHIHLFIIKPFKIFFKPMVLDIINNEIRIWGNPKKLVISKKASMVNTIFNTSSGYIEIGDYTFAGHNVSIITGAHNYELLLEKRMNDFYHTGGDIKIGKGVWLGSNATVLGPCTIGDNAVIAAGSVVPPNSNIPPNTIVAGIPAKIIKHIEYPVIETEMVN